MMAVVIEMDNHSVLGRIMPLMIEGASGRWPKET
jgi:hypothetical protein